MRPLMSSGGGASTRPQSTLTRTDNSSIVVVVAVDIADGSMVACVQCVLVALTLHVVQPDLLIIRTEAKLRRGPWHGARGTGETQLTAHHVGSFDVKVGAAAHGAPLPVIFDLHATLRGAGGLTIIVQSYFCYKSQ